ncbi:hypothetical protein OAP14_08035 [Aliiglaciecola sp.]|nr:hypothetical protein [Aliiglaciecola sp.]
MEIDTFKHILVVFQADEDNIIPLARATRLCLAMSAKMTVFISCHDSKNHPKQLRHLSNKVMWI